MNRARYVDRLRDADVLTVAGELGIETFDGRGTSPGSFPCAACSVETRHGERRRGACGVRTDGKGWRCFECDASGDALDLVAWVLKGSRFRDLDDEGRKRVREWVDRRDGISSPEHKLHVVHPPPQRPPADLVSAVWRECARVDEDAEVAGWLESKRIDVNRVADLDLARALPPRSTTMPTWASGGQRLIVPLRDAEGEAKSLKARRVDGGKEYKSLSPKGYTAAGLAFFDPRVADPKRVWIVEGEKKFLQLATRCDDHEAVYGVGSGMYSRELIARIPQDAEVIIATDADPKHQAGAKYATDIIRLLTPQQRRRARLWNSLEVVGEPGARKVQVREQWRTP